MKRTSDEMQMSDVGYSGGDYGKPVSMKDLKRGFTQEVVQEECCGDCEEPIPFGGFAGRPNGFER